MANENLARTLETREDSGNSVTYISHTGQVRKISSNLYHLVKKPANIVNIWLTTMDSFPSLSLHTLNILKWGVVKVSPGRTRESLNGSEVERMPIETLSQLVEYSKKELIYNGFTRKALNELGAILNTYGLFLKPDYVNGHYKEENLRAYKEMIRGKIIKCPKKEEDLEWKMVLSRAIK